MTRRQYSCEFKISAVKLVNEQDYSVVKAAMCLAATSSAATHTFQPITLDEKSLSAHQVGEPAGAYLH